MQGFVSFVERALEQEIDAEEDGVESMFTEFLLTPLGPSPCPASPCQPADNQTGVEQSCGLTIPLP